MIEERPPRAAPHTPSDDPRVKMLALRLLPPREKDFVSVRERCWDDARDLLARLDAAAPARDDALDRVTVVLPDPEGVERDGAMHWRVHDYTGDDEYGAEGETWTVQLDVAGVVHLDGNPIAPATDLALAVLAAARCRDRLGATTNTTPEEGL